MELNKTLIKKDIKQAVLPIGLAASLIILSNIILGKVCIMRMLFGIPCPGCGITRAFILLSQGKIKEATIMHPFWIAIVVLLIAFLINRYFVKDKKMSKKVMSVLKVCAIITLLLCIVYYIYRMIAWYPQKEPVIYDSENVFNILVHFINKNN